MESKTPTRAKPPADGKGRRPQAFYLKQYQRLVAHVICHSLGYACPKTAANIIADAHEGRDNWCEWLIACYNGNAKKCVGDAYRHRRSHSGYMAEYRQAREIVRRSVEEHIDPLFASWF